MVLYHFREYLPSRSPEWLSGLSAQGYLAVDLFFILSGFVLALNYAESFRDSLAGAAGFYWLRFARIYPLHFVMLTLFLLNPLAVALFSASGDTSEYRWDYFLLSLFLAPELGLLDRASLECSRLVDQHRSLRLSLLSPPPLSLSLFPPPPPPPPFAAFLIGRVIVTIRSALLAMAALLMALG